MRERTEEMAVLTKRRAVLATAVLATYQFLHAFDPSASFIVQIAQSLGLTNKEYYAVVAPFRAWFLLPWIVVAGLTFEFLGYRASLLVLGSVLTVQEVLRALAVALHRGHDASLTLLEAAAGVGGIAFSGGFIVNCGMFSLLPTAYYQAASSANSIAMMVGSLVSSFAGQGLVHVLPEIGQTVYVALALVASSVVLVLVAMCARVLPPLRNVLGPREWVRRAWRRTVFYHSSSEVLEWSAFNAVVLATHTLVKGMWKSLFADINPAAGKLNNGLINGITCGAAALAMVVLSLLPRATARVARPVLCLFPLVSAAIFVGMAYAPSILVGTVLLVTYNAASECALVMSSVMMAKSMNDAEEARISGRVKVGDDDPAATAIATSTPNSSSKGEAAAASTYSTFGNTAINNSPSAESEGAQSEKAEGSAVVVTTGAEGAGEGSRDEPANDGAAKQKKLVDFALMFTLNSVISILVQDLFNVVAIYVLNLNSREWFIGFAAVGCALSSCVTASSIVKAYRKSKH